MMRSLATSVVILLACTPALAAAAAAPSSCGPPFRVEQESFQVLPRPAKYAAVWVDNIPSKLFGGFRPFELFVVVGQVFPPFQTERGKLERRDFSKIKLNPDVIRYDRMTVDAPLSSAQLSFPNNDLDLTLRVVTVESVWFGEDSVTLQLCWRSP